MYGASKPPPHASYYHPKFVPGARLPHAWINFPDEPSRAAGAAKGFLLAQGPVDVSYIKELNQNQVQACQWSTLDLCGPDSWTLILGREQQNTHIALLQEHCENVGLSINTWCLGLDFELVRQSWFADELTNNGGILIRPDQHILARLVADTTGEDVIAEVNKYLGI